MMIMMKLDTLINFCLPIRYPQQQPYPETPEEKINWQEQIRMIHLRSHLNQLLEKVKHAQYVTDKTR